MGGFSEVLPIAANKELAFRDTESAERLRGSADFSLSCGLTLQVSKLQLQITSHEPQFLPTPSKRVVLASPG